ncbi:intraflagellar transport protein 22 homolog [Plakobranchus ocellatus]|uniref:Intraflagellar transport protein 22 homolog n=1 Tax=Plakobranchus ocellatus TaxID=259542 RepID=A0AAV3ZZ52_9GAST|nr:intraflagellar transport protein 22 homolog [Plakobranchus ocellatus]
MSKAKVVVVGPCEAGKTVLCNFLADATEFSGGEYHPTQAVRIVEFETNAPDKSRSALDVELWDCSGDRRFESCWPAMIRDASGAIFVYNPDMPNHDKELDTWLSFIVNSSKLKPKRCLCVAMLKPGADHQVRSKPRESALCSSWCTMNLALSPLPAPLGY